MRKLHSAAAMVVLAVLFMTADGAAAQVEPPPLGAGLRPGSVRLPEPRLAPEEPPPAPVGIAPGVAPTPSSDTPPAGRAAADPQKGRKQP